MSIKITCVQCGKSHKVNDRLAGKRVRCPGCDTAVHVPELPISAESVPATPDSVEPVVAQAVVADSVEAVPVQAAAVAAVPVDASEPKKSRAAAVSQTTTANSDSQRPPIDDDDDEPVMAREPRDMGELDMTPMVDVTFLLLIFFVVTASFQLQKSIMMPRQQTDAPSTNSVEDQPDELDQVELQIDEFGAFTVLAADWEAETPGKQNLVTKLKEAQTEAGAKLIIKVHEQCMLQALVDGMDAGTIADYQEIEVTQVDQFD